MENREELDWESELWKVVFLGISNKIKDNKTLSKSQQSIYDIIKQTDEFQEICKQDIKGNDKIIDGDVFIHKRTGNKFVYHFPLRVLSDFFNKEK